MNATVPGDRQLLLDAIRCWNIAQEIRQPAQPSLFPLLDANGYPMLAPVFDSLMRIYVGALGRVLRIGSDSAASADEQNLIGLLDGSADAPCFDCGEGAATALRCALCSTRIMLTMASGARE